MAQTCLEVAQRAGDQGIGVTVVDPRWVIPVDPALITLARQHSHVAVVEDGTRIGGVGSRVAQVLTDAGVETPVMTFGLPGGFLAQGTRSGLLREAGLGAQDIARRITESVTHRSGQSSDAASVEA